MVYRMHSPDPKERRIKFLQQRVEELERLTDEHQQFREQLQIAEERYRNIFTHSPSGYALHQLVTDDAGEPVDFQFVETNEVFLEMIGKREHEVVGRPASEILPNDQLQPLLQIYARVIARREPVRFEHYDEGLGKFFDVSVLSPRAGQFSTIITDVTARKQTEETLKLRTVYFEQLFESSPLAIVLLDNDDRVVDCNQGFENLFGYTKREARRRFISSLIVREGQLGEASGLSARVFQGEIVDAEGVRYHKDGTPIDVRILAHPIRLDERQIGIYGIYSDISRRKRDVLTGLVNRSSFLERLQLELERAIRESKLTAVIALDIDHLKDVNDTYGQDVGDLLLQAVAHRLRQTLRVGASIARIGGDEFGVLQLDLLDVANAAGLARRLMAALDEPFVVAGRRIHIGASVGIAVARAGRWMDAKQLVAQAERALSQAKAEGRCAFKFYAAQMDQEVQARMLLGQELHGAVERRELFLEYQPQISLPECRIVGVEALLRWRHPNGTVIGPDRFVPVAEASGVIVPIGDWVLRAACSQAEAWRRTYSVGLPVAVNLSAVQFKNPLFADSVVRALDESGLEPDLLELELTERILVEATPIVRESLRKLQGLGVRFTLDDFGKGYSSLEYLRQLPLQKLKIDRSFIRNIEADSSDAAIVSAITVLGSKLGLKVVAEGVERQSQLDLLVTEGCHEIQGFFFSPPVGAEKVARLLVEGNGSIRPTSRDH